MRQSKRNDGRYRQGSSLVQYPVTEDEEVYAFHLCQWLRVVAQLDHPDQQVCARRMQDGKPHYLLGGHWYGEEDVAPRESLPPFL